MKLFIKKLPLAACAVIFLFFFGTVTYLTLHCEFSHPSDYSAEKSVEIHRDWLAEDGTSAGNAEDLNLLPQSSVTEEHSIFNVIPDNIPKGAMLSFRVKHLMYSVFIDGENVYNVSAAESRLYTNSVGVNWVMVPISADDAGKTLELRYKLCYENSPCGIDSVKVEVGNQWVIWLIKEKFGAILTSLIYIILAVAFVVVDIPISKTLNKSHAFLYLGLMTFAIALFCLAETQLFQIFVNDDRIMHLITCYALMLGPMPVIMYADSIFPFRYKYTVTVFAVINILIFIINTSLNISGLRDYHDTLFVLHADIIASIIMMLISIIKYIISGFKQKKKLDAYLFLEISGILALMLTGVIDVCGYYFYNSNDLARYVRIGILLFVICFAISNCEKIHGALVLNARNELIAKLAYLDGLTNLYNRTAYNETLEKLQKKYKYIGICGFDVNDLKKINDNLGHDMGDNLIRESGNIISTAFPEKESVCFRIGGDEFTVVLYGDNIDERIRTSMDKVYSLCDKFNNAGNYPFRISIAGGSSVYDGTISIEETAKKADMLMYENKKKMKESETKPPFINLDGHTEVSY